MESFLNENFDVETKHSSEETLQKWRNLSGMVKHPKRRFRFTANLSKRFEATAMRKSNEEKLSFAVQESIAAIFQFIQENVHWLILFTSLVIEGLSTLFEQLNYAMLGMLMAIFGLLISAAEFASGAYIEQVTVEWRGMLPLLYSHYPTHKPFGSTMLYFGLVAAIWQCIHASVGYIYACKGAENPIKMAITMFLFCACLVVSKLVNKYS